jgi:hypothetical protein
MSYLNSEITYNALISMHRFFGELERLYEKYDISLLNDQCRRNNIMSASQEKFFAAELENEHGNVRNDGRTGEPDIILEGLGKELECKLTSPKKSGGVSFQTDYVTLCNKGSLDYLYVIADPWFRRFCVLHFKGLETGDFFFPASGSRGKARMNKDRAMDKCTVLWGKAFNINDETLDRFEHRLLGLSDRAVRTKAKLESQIVALKSRSRSYRFELESILPTYN